VKIEESYSHLNGLEWLMVRRPSLWREIRSVIEAIDVSALKPKRSKEKRKAGALVYAPKAINARFAEEFRARDWSKRRTNYWVTRDHALISKTLALDPADQKKMIADAGLNPIPSYNETDFVKDRVAVEVQFGKYAFIAYDLFVKHLAFYVRDTIDLGVEILPMKSMQSAMSSGPGYFEGALYDLVREGRGVPAVPLILIGVVP
jgi:hypothetical protein